MKLSTDNVLVTSWKNISWMADIKKTKGRGEDRQEVLDVGYCYVVQQNEMSMMTPELGGAGVLPEAISQLTSGDSEETCIC